MRSRHLREPHLCTDETLKMTLQGDLYRLRCQRNDGFQGTVFPET